MKMNQGISRVAMFILMQNDLEKTVAFYKDLGLRVLFHLTGRWAELEIGEVKLGLCPTTQELPDRHTGIVLQVDDLKEFCQKNKDILDMLSEPVEKAHGIMVSFRDPGKNILDLYQPTPEKVESIVQKAKQEEGKSGKKSACSDSCC